MLDFPKDNYFHLSYKEKVLVQSLAMVSLLGFELSYYLLIVQTGITSHFNSDLFSLYPLFIGGVLGTLLSGRSWAIANDPMQKIMIALSLQLLLSFIYPNYNLFTLGLLGLSVGMMAPLSIYIFKHSQKLELFFALALAYGVGTYFFTSYESSRGLMAVSFSILALSAALVLKDYKLTKSEEEAPRSLMMMLPLMLWIFLDSNLFETLSRSQNLDIWSHQTYTIIFFHIMGLIAAFSLNVSEKVQHLIIAVLLGLSYLTAYLELPLLLAVVYPFAISYYNMVIFSILTREGNLAFLSGMMVLIAWIASGLGLGLALSGILF